MCHSRGHGQTAYLVVKFEGRADMCIVIFGYVTNRYTDRQVEILPKEKRLCNVI